MFRASCTLHIGFKAHHLTTWKSLSSFVQRKDAETSPKSSHSKVREEVGYTAVGACPCISLALLQ